MNRIFPALEVIFSHCNFYISHHCRCLDIETRDNQRVLIVGQLTVRTVPRSPDYFTGSKSTFPRATEDQYHLGHLGLGMLPAGLFALPFAQSVHMSMPLVLLWSLLGERCLACDLLGVNNVRQPISTPNCKLNG
jgi:hypothetical protein